MVIKKKCAVFISGNGSNLESIIKESKKSDFPVKVESIITDNINSRGLNFGKTYNIKCYPVDYKSFSKKENFESKILEILSIDEIEIICLAGYMKILSSLFINSFNDLDLFISNFMSKWGTTLLRYSLGIIYIWFGVLKPFGLSPAQELVENTIYWFDDPKTFVPILGIWEVVIGITMCIKPLIRVSIFLLFLQMPGTFLPLILLPEVCFTSFPFGLTLEGQYIVKNLIIISAALVLGSTVRK